MRVCQKSLRPKRPTSSSKIAVFQARAPDACRKVEDMSRFHLSRRSFLRAAGVAAGAAVLSSTDLLTQAPVAVTSPSDAPADYTLTIATKPIELAPNRIVSVTTYNGQFPGPLLRLKEGERVTVDIRNETDTPEQLHWHGQFLSTESTERRRRARHLSRRTAAAEFRLCRSRRDLRFYHTHVRAGANLADGQYSGQVGPVYIEPKQHPGNYDREVFLTLKEFQPTLSRGGDMAMDFLSPAHDRRATQEQRREPDEGLARQGHAARLRSWLRASSPSTDECSAMASRCGSSGASACCFTF